MPNGAKASGASVQSIAVLVTSHVIYGVVLKMEQKSRMNTVPTNINPDQSARVTRNVAAVNGKSASGTSVQKRVEREQQLEPSDVFINWNTKATRSVTARHDH